MPLSIDDRLVCKPAGFTVYYFRNLNAMSPEIGVSARQNSIMAEPCDIMFCGN